jgi:hypothetical protein
MRPKLTVVVLVSISLLLFGFRPDAMPYLRHEARYSDAVLAHWPNALFFRESIVDRGEFPVWRETTMAGQPFAANPLNKTYYPFQWLVLIFSPALHLNLLILFHLFLAGAGMWIWARSLGLRMEAAALSALAYTLAPRVVGHTGAGHLDVLYALAWWPLLMWAIRQMAVAEGRWGENVLQVGLLLALVFLADVRVSLFAFGCAGVYLLIELKHHRQWKRFVLFVVSGLIGLILSLSLLIPLFLWQPYMSRASLTLSDAGVLALQPIHFLGLILPAHRPSIETLTYLGLPVAALAAFGIASFPRPQRILGGGGLVVVALYAMGDHAFLWPLLVKFVSALLWFRVPSKAWLILALIIPLLAGYGLQWLLYQSENRIRFRRLELVIVIGMGVSVAIGIFSLFILRLPPSMGISAIVGGLLLGGALLLILNPRVNINANRIFLLLFTLTFVDLVWTDYQWADWRDESIWLDPSRPLAERLVEESPDRIYSPTYSLEQQVAEAYHLHLFGGVDPFQLKGIVEAVSQGSGVSMLKYDPVLPSLGGAEGDNDVAQANRDAVINAKILADWNVSHVVAAYPIENNRLQLLDKINNVYIYTNLDYYALEQASTIPNWPTNWPDLPDASTVAQLNQTTITVAFISGVCFLICLAALIMMKMRKIRARTR